MRQTEGRHVVIAGGSFAGLGAAFTLRRELDREDRITVIDPDGQFVFAPSLIWAALGRPLVHSSFALEPTLSTRGIHFIRSHVRQVNAEGKRIATDDQELSYDRLLIATGGRADTTAIPGLAGEFNTNNFIVGLDSAESARRVLRALFSDPGPIVIGAAQGATYYSGVYELALAIDSALRDQGIRDRAPITFVTDEPYLGHFGFGQTAAMEKLTAMFGEREIVARTGVEVEAVRRDSVTLATGESLSAKAAFLMPPFTGAVDIWKSAGLTDEHGMVSINDEYRHTEFEDIYAAGVAALFNRAIPPLTGRQPPHTGYLAIHMGKHAGQNIAASLGSGQRAHRTLPYLLDVRILDGGTTGLLLASRGHHLLKNTAVRVPGPLAHWLKRATERYLTWRLRTGQVNLP